ncbi:MAG TPA: AAA family ATPase [Blastocatellia bacterium]|nr:AAA family ATPase [Blastocatellia bacterium]
MEIERRIIFDPFYLDLANERLFRGSQAIKLRPKAFAVLTYLLARPAQLVTKEELLNAVWPETFVGDGVLKVTIRQLRNALSDDSKSPRFIETAHRRGYRFIGQITEGGQRPAEDQQIGRRNKAISASPLSSAYPSPGVVGRDKALSRMHGWLDKVLMGERQIVFVTGEAGIGKTALVDTFTRSIAADRGIRIGRGQCLEQYGTSEAYLPVLEAIGRLCRERGQAIDVLRAHAPMWLLQMPSLVSASDRELLSREVFGQTRERMLREMGEALETLTKDRPLVLVLEDLHWGDYSTIDLISYLARQRQPAHFMLIGTYRPAELIVSGHPLKAVKQELLAKHNCEELPLEYLSEAAVARYLSVRFPNNRFPERLAGLIHERTEGNPLFMVNAVDYLVSEGLIGEHEGHWELVVEIERVEVGVPDSIKQMIEKQLDLLDPEQQRTLEAASAAGAEFSALAVVAGLAEDRAAVEARCDELARHHQFIQDCGVHELPNGEATTRYGFIHALYRNVLYERVSAARRVQLHRRIAEQGEEVYRERVGEIAAELAMHFEQSSNFRRAAKYLQQAANNAIRRFAYQEAVGLSRRGLELLWKVPDTPERAHQELCLQLTLGVPLIATEGYAAPEVGCVYLRARELCQQLGETPDVSEALWGLWTFHTLRAELGTAREIAGEYLRLAERLPYPGLAMRGHWALEITFMHLGEFALAMEHFEKALLLYDPERHLDDGFFYALHPGVAMPCFAAWALWCLGQPDQALVRIQDALTLARERSEPLGLAHALFFATILYQLRREGRMAQECAEAAIAVSREHGLVLYQAMATITRGWALTEQGLQEEAIEQMRLGLADLQATGTDLVSPHFLALLGEALGKGRQPEEGLRLLGEALEMAHRNGEGYYLAELYRIKGELLLMQATVRGLSRAATPGKVVFDAEPPAVAQAEACFNQSIKIAQQQQAKSWELRAGMSLGRLYQNLGKKEEASGLLKQIYNWFTEGFDTVDLREARALIDELSETSAKQQSPD